MSDHIIDCDQTPFIPDGWKLERHYPCGQVIWDAENTYLWRAGDRTNIFMPEGDTFRLSRTLLTGDLTYNACALDYFLKHRSLIPESWRGDVVAFPGTIYRNNHGKLDFRYMYWDEEDDWVADDIGLLITVIWMGCNRPAAPRLKKKKRARS